jgi:hypothetical protein
MLTINVIENAVPRVLQLNFVVSLGERRLVYSVDGQSNMRSISWGIRSDGGGRQSCQAESGGEKSVLHDASERVNCITRKKKIVVNARWFKWKTEAVKISFNRYI